MFHYISFEKKCKWVYSFFVTPYLLYAFFMSFSVGLVGLPNVGKSTLFQSLTKKQVAAENYPFCTIDPNVGVVPVPDSRLTALATMSKSKKIVPTTVTFVDIAGLVAGAHKGEGLGNQFLSHIREVDAIVQVLRHFKDPDVTHVSGKVDPLADEDIINIELAMSDLQTVEKRKMSLEKEVRSGDKNAVAFSKALDRLSEALNKNVAARSLDFDPQEELPFVKQLHLLTMKPMLYVLNTDEGVVYESISEDLKKLKPLLICAKLEAELVGLPQNEVQEYLKESGIEITGLDQLIVASYNILQLISFLTTGEKESRAWTIEKGTLAPQAAGRIHTDFIKGFIKADVIPYKDLLSAGSWVAAKELGKVRTEGKDYIVQDGDTVEFKVKS